MMPQNRVSIFPVDYSYVSKIVRRTMSKSTFPGYGRTAKASRLRRRSDGLIPVSLAQWSVGRLLLLRPTTAENSLGDGNPYAYRWYGALELSRFHPVKPERHSLIKDCLNPLLVTVETLTPDAQPHHSVRLSLSINPSQRRSIDLRQTLISAKTNSEVQLRKQRSHNMVDTRLSTFRQAPEDRAAELHEVGAESNGFESAHSLALAASSRERGEPYMSAPERIPPSKPMVMRPLTAPTTSCSASRDAIAPSIWRPPCFGSRQPGRLRVGKKGLNSRWKRQHRPSHVAPPSPHPRPSGCP
jgi:hypothetical protein